jgi:hypothetical protein
MTMPGFSLDTGLSKPEVIADAGNQEEHQDEQEDA